MIAIRKCDAQYQTGWQDDFVEILPEIQQQLGRAFRGLDPAAADDAVADAVIHSLLAFRRLHAAGRTAAVSAANLSWYGRLQVRTGRLAACRQNAHEPLSRYAQRRRGFRVERLGTVDGADADWIVAIVADRRASVPDQVALRLDFAAWLASLPARWAAIAKDLACGCSTGETARKFLVTAGRISQLRRELEQSWNEFQSETTVVTSR